jgi:hypothetical protein
MSVQQVNVFAIINSDVLIISRDAFVNLQDRVMRQYTNQGRRGAYQRDLSEYEKMVELGKALSLGGEVLGEQVAQ